MYGSWVRLLRCRNCWLKGSIESDRNCQLRPQLTTACNCLLSFCDSMPGRHACPPALQSNLPDCRDAAHHHCIKPFLQAGDHTLRGYHPSDMQSSPRRWLTVPLVDTLRQSLSEPSYVPAPLHPSLLSWEPSTEPKISTADSVAICAMMRNEEPADVQAWIIWHWCSTAQVAWHKCDCACDPAAQASI